MKLRIGDGLPELKIKTKGSLKDIYGKRRHFIIEEDPIIFQQHNYREKVFILQRIRFEDDSKELRLGYYIIGKRGRMNGRWAWGQFCPILPEQDFKQLFSEAKTRGWL